MRVVGDSWSDPDAKPVCGTPQGGCHAAAVAPSFGACTHAAKVRARTGNEGLPLRQARGTNPS